MSIEKLIADLVTQVEKIPAFILVQRALTLDGCIPEEDKLAPLTSAECYAIECITNRHHRFSTNGQISLAFRPHGRLYFLPRKDFEAHSEFLTLLGHVELSEDELLTYLALKQSEQCALEQERTVILNYLVRHGVENVCGELLALSVHMAPLIYYVGERCVSNFYDIGKSGFKLESTLAQTLKEVIEQRKSSSIESLTTAYCMHLLLHSGSYTRLEELNSSQLSRPVLDKYLDVQYGIYQKTGGIRSDVNAFSMFSSSSLEKKAVLLADMRKSVESTTSRFSRHINSVNLCKKEVILPIPPVQANASLASVNPSARTMALLQRWMGQSGSAQQAFLPSSFGELLKELIASEEVPFPSRLESLVDYVVAEAVRSTRSDFGMTRCARDFLKFSTALCQGQAELVCAWGQAEYICHVVPNEKMKAEYPPKTLTMILSAISGRMRFNAWHYAPSYFKIESIPADRGWFYAPRMADIADCSDHHHTGHMHATVRYSIRSPLPICIRETMLPGFIDLRLMRQSGDPYSREDLVTAIAYTEALQFIYQSLMNFVLKENKNFVFSFGDKKWFDKVYSPKRSEMVTTIA
ncbi:MAG: hypothetical protein Q7U91_10715 [Sideroxyarcus sp.]|nr:hypothetical protein [Sideroxyarcus sp.]